MKTKLSKVAKLRKAETEFFDCARKLLIEHGAVKGESDKIREEYTLTTPIGGLRLTLDLDGDGLTIIFSRFVRVKAGWLFTGKDSNQFSGKWNHLYNRDLDALEMAKGSFSYAITKLMTFQPTKEFWAEVLRLETEEKTFWEKTCHAGNRTT